MFVGDEMKAKLINDINNYISFLNAKGLFVTVHGKEISGLLEHNTHNNPFCLLVKTDSSAWQHCVACQQKVFALSNKEVLFGMCHAGLEEYVFFVNNKTFISVSGYGIDKVGAKKRIYRLSQNFCLDFSELLNVYENGLKHQPENIEDLKIIINPLCHMISLLHMLLFNVPEHQSQNKMFDSIIAFVNRNYMRNISLSDIAYACSCSESTICHLFKYHTGISTQKYILNLRLEQAKKLLKTSSFTITDIALMSGFNNSNYFSTTFKKEIGMSPNEYRKYR